MRVRERMEAPGEVVEPVLAHLGQRQREQCPGGLGAHRREIAQVDGERLVPDRPARRAGEEVPALHQRVGRRDERAPRGHVEQRRVVADAEQHVAAASTGA